MKSTFWAAVAGALVLGCSAQAAEITVAAASDLKFALDEVMAEFHRSNSNVRVQASYASSGNLYAQITQRAPYDLFLSADITYPERLIEAGHAMGASKFTYAIGHLVVWARNDSAVDPKESGASALKHPAVRKIAIANPEHAPYGRAAVAALRHLSLYEELKGKLVYGENIAQTAQFVDTGAADIGIIALSLAVAPAMKGRGRYWEVPLDAYPPLEQGGVILSSTRDLKSAQRFREFILSDRGKAILQRYGFFVPRP